MIFLWTFTTYGQSKRLIMGVNKGKDIQFYVEEFTPRKESKSILVKTATSNSKLSVTKDDDKRKTIEGAYLEDRHLVPSIVNSTLAQKVPEFKKLKTNIIIRMYPNYDGTLKSVEYVMDKNLAISVDELESISKKILEQVHIKFPEKVDRNILIAPFVQNVRFR